MAPCGASNSCWAPKRLRQLPRARLLLLQSNDALSITDKEVIHAWGRASPLTRERRWRDPLVVAFAASAAWPHPIGAATSNDTHTRRQVVFPLEVRHRVVLVVLGHGAADLGNLLGAPDTAEVNVGVVGLAAPM